MSARKEATNFRVMFSVNRNQLLAGCHYFEVFSLD